MEARVVQDLDLKGQRACAGKSRHRQRLSDRLLAAARAARVTSVEIDPALAKFGADNLARAGITNATGLTGDAARGWRARHRTTDRSSPVRWKCCRKRYFPN